MPVELLSLVVLSLLSLVLWAPASLAKYRTFGSLWLASNRDPIAGKVVDGWGARSERAYQNFLANLPGFVAIVFVLGYLGAFSDLTSWCCGIFAVARICHFIVYTAGWVYSRVVAFTVAWVAVLVLNAIAVFFFINMPR